jgi:hypothetical protein
MGAPGWDRQQQLRMASVDRENMRGAARGRKEIAISAAGTYAAGVGSRGWHTVGGLGSFHLPITDHTRSRATPWRRPRGDLSRDLRAE